MTAYYPIVLDPNADPQNSAYSLLREIPANSVLDLTQVDATIRNLNINGYIYQRVISATTTLDLSQGSYFKINLDSSKIVSFTNPPANNVALTISVEVVNLSNYSISWQSNIYWDGDLAPTILQNSTSIFTFLTSDGGVTWRGNLVMNTLY